MVLVAVVSAGYYQITPGRVAPCPRGTWKSAEAANCTACVGAGVTTPGEAAISALNCSGMLISNVHSICECRQVQLMCFRMTCWTTYEVHCGSVVFHLVMSFVGCCPMSLVGLPKRRSGKALTQQGSSK
jgi:hypothetical protein